MGSRGSSQTTQTIQQADPWAGVQPHLRDLYGQTGAWYHSGNKTVGNTYDTEWAKNMVRQTAAAGSPAMRQANWTVPQLTSGNYVWQSPIGSGRYLSENPFATGQLTGQNRFATGEMLNRNRTAQGDFLNAGNPHLRAMVDAASRPVIENFQNAIAPAIASQFSLAGRTGSGAHAMAFDNASKTITRQLGDISAGLYGGNYEAERNRMETARDAELNRMLAGYEGELGRRAQAFAQERGAQHQMFADQPKIQLAGAGMAPSLRQADYYDAMQVRDTGILDRQIAQDLNDDWFKRLAGYNSILSGATAYGTTTGSQSANVPGNRYAGALGGAMMGGSVFGPIGAGIGGLAGLFL